MIRKNLYLALVCGFAAGTVVPAVVEAGGCGWSSSACGRSMFPRRARNYLFHRRPSMFDLVSEIRSIPIYANSLYRQAEAQVARMEKSSPRYEMHEGPDGGVELTLEVPGVEAKDISVELEDHKTLRIRGSRRYHHRGATMESEYDQTFRMDDTVDVEKLSVTLSAGLLRISAPRKEKRVLELPVKSLDVDKVVEAKVISKLDKEDVVDAKLEKDFDKAQAESEEVVDGLQITEDEK